MTLLAAALRHKPESVIEVPTRPTEPAGQPGGRPFLRLVARRRITVRAVWLLVLSSLGVWVLVWSFLLSPAVASRSQHQLYQQFRTQLVREIAPLGGKIPVGAPLALITAARSDVRDLVIVEGTDSATLANGPGHLRSSVLPGQAGTTYIFGRSVLFGGPFGDLHRLRAGSPIQITTQQGQFTYLVERIRRPGDPAAPPLESKAGRLVLVSAEGTGWRGGWAPTRPVYVDARLKGLALPVSSGGQPVTRAEFAMHGSTSGLVLVVLGLQALLLAVSAMLWGLARWGQAQACLAGTPVVLAALWLVTTHAVTMLPNLL